MMNEEILENLNDSLDQAINRGRKILDEKKFKKHTEELQIKAEKLIREHPLKSIGAGLLAGYVLGRLLSSDK